MAKEKTLSDAMVPSKRLRKKTPRYLENQDASSSKKRREEGGSSLPPTSGMLSLTTADKKGKGKMHTAEEPPKKNAVAKSEEQAATAVATTTNLATPKFKIIRCPLTDSNTHAEKSITDFPITQTSKRILDELATEKGIPKWAFLEFILRNYVRPPGEELFISFATNKGKGEVKCKRFPEFKIPEWVPEEET